MTKEIVLKTDASYKKGVGCGISYNVNIEWGEENVQYKNSKFTKRIKNSTHGELTSTAYGVFKTIEKVNDLKEYEIKIETDCEYVVDVLNERYPEQPKLIKAVLNALDRFAEWSINWIPRVKNTEADVLAHSELMRHE